MKLRLPSKVKIVVLAGSVVATLLMATVAYAANLVGDEVRVGHHSPTLGVEEVGEDVTVVNGPADAVNIFNIYAVDVDACSISVDYLVDSNAFWDFPVDFNGLVVSDLAVAPTGLTIDTNITGWADSRASFTADSVMFDFQGLGGPFDSEWYLTATIAGCSGSTKADILQASGVPGNGIGNAPGLQKEFNPNSEAAENVAK